MSAERQVVVIGSLNVDFTTRTTRLPALGETLTSESFDIGFGGKGANQAIACAKLSRPASSEVAPRLADEVCNVKMIGVVGDDQWGQDITDSLNRHGIDSREIHQLAGQKTGVAVIIVETQTGDNRILLSPNANYLWQPDFIRIADPLPSVIVMQLEIPLHVVLDVLMEAKRRDVDVVLNPAPATHLPSEAYDGLQHLIMNETEAGILSGATGSLLDSSSLDKVSEHFLSNGVTNVVITLGEQGVFYRTRKERLGHLLAAKKVKVVDTTAAGDTFVGAYANEVALGRTTRFDLHAAVDFANRAASVTVQRNGAQASIPLRDEVPP